MRLTIFELCKLGAVWMAILAMPTGTMAGAQAGDAKPAQTYSVDSVSWMTGNWETEPGSFQIDERWGPVAGGTMFGTSRTVAGDRTVFFEFIRIEGRADGVFYVAQPKGRFPGVDFRLVRATASEAVFENLTHDFPKRIIYRKGADGSLTARIEGDGTEKEKPQDFKYRPASR